jgi:hypothetical protein
MNNFKSVIATSLEAEHYWVRIIVAKILFPELTK